MITLLGSHIHKAEYGKIKFSDLTVVDVLVAEFRESIQPAIPQINVLLSDPDKKIHQVGPEISGRGKKSTVSTMSEHHNFQNVIQDNISEISQLDAFFRGSMDRALATFLEQGNVINFVILMLLASGPVGEGTI